MALAALGGAALAPRVRLTPSADGIANASRELLHDADEGLLGFDCISVLMPFLGEAYRLLTERLENAIVLRYRLPP